MSSYVLSEDDRRKLNDLFTNYNRLMAIVDRDGRSDNIDLQAPDTYIALIPSGGLTGQTFTYLSGTGTHALISDQVVPGYADDCQIYLITEISPFGGGIFLSPLGKTERIYNLSQLAIAAGAYVPVTRLKSGQWVVAGSSPTGIVKGVLSTGMSYAGSATVRLWYRISGVETDSGVDVTAYDWALKSGQSMIIGTQVIVGYDPNSGVYYVLTGQCG